MRVVRGIRGYLASLGLLAACSGTILAGGYSLLRFPSGYQLGTDRSLAATDYPSPNWLLQAGLVLLGAGSLAVAVAYFTAPTWRPGLPAPGGNRLVVPFLITAITVALGSFTTVVVAGRDSPQIGFVWFIGGLVVAVCVLFPALQRRRRL